MNWPNINQFTEALHNPNLSVHIPQLPYPTISRNKNGRPLLWAGNFAAVYQLISLNSQYALRCFTTPPSGKHLHYHRLSNSLNRQLPFLTPFHFHQDAILISGRKFPAITMQWINGSRLDSKVQSHLLNPQLLKNLANSISQAALSLETLGLAHNDLQHANIIVQDDNSIKLVDYDAFFIPHYLNSTAPEAGHPNYQHPSKSLNHFNHRSDRFPSLVIYLSLYALAADPSLWSFYNQDNLIFTKQDFLYPNSSPAIAQTSQSPDPYVQLITRTLLQSLSRDPNDTPTPPTPTSAAPTAKLTPAPKPLKPAAPNATTALIPPQTAAITPTKHTRNPAPATPKPSAHASTPKSLRIPLLPLILIPIIILFATILAAGCANPILNAFSNPALSQSSPDTIPEPDNPSAQLIPTGYGKNRFILQGRIEPHKTPF